MGVKVVSDGRRRRMMVGKSMPRMRGSSRKVIEQSRFNETIDGRTLVFCNRCKYRGERFPHFAYRCRMVWKNRVVVNPWGHLCGVFDQCRKKGFRTLAKHHVARGGCCNEGLDALSSCQRGLVMQLGREST